MKFKREPSKMLGISMLALVFSIIIIYFCADRIISVILTLIKLTLPFILGYVFTALIKPVNIFLEKKLKIPKKLSAVLVLILFFGIIGSILTAIVFKAVDEAKQLYFSSAEIIEQISDNTAEFTGKFSSIFHSLPQSVQDMLNASFEGVSSSVSDFIKKSSVITKTGTFAKKLPSFFIGFVAFILSSFFIMSDDGKIKNTMHKILSENTINNMRKISVEIHHYLGGYIKAQATLMCIVFCILSIGFYFIEIKYALLIALAVAFIDAIPFFGTGITLLPWAAVCIINGDFKKGIVLIVLYLTVQITRQFTEPKILGDQIGMHPLLTLMSMYSGYKLFSIGGMILGPIVLMLIISVYRAGIFDKPFKTLKIFIKSIKKELIKTSEDDINE